MGAKAPRLRKVRSAFQTLPIHFTALLEGERAYHPEDAKNNRASTSKCAICVPMAAGVLVR
jgi:hypothetical protein